MDHDVDVLIIGAGMSGLNFAVQMVRNYGNRNFEIVEKASKLGGTWWVNSYPGCGCDVPSHFYSYSFALNPNWTAKFTMQPEIEAYFNGVAEQYDINKHIQFDSMVKSARWDDISGTWTVDIEDSNTSSVRTRRCKVLVSAVGALSTPKKCDIPGASSFQGKMFHTAQWDHSFDWKDKEVVMIGNGCSATQTLPVMSMGPEPVRHITQFAQQAHWLDERPNPEYSSLFKWTMAWVPLAMRIYRAHLYWQKESEFRGFDTAGGKTLRQNWTQKSSKYIKENSPAKYHEFLIPKTEIACKRRVNDTDYLASLHQDNVDLVYDDPIAEVLPTGVRTKSGRTISADAIVLAHGFETQKLLVPMEIVGRGGIDVYKHWDEVSEGLPSSYFGTCLSGFPNFFIMMGPNTLSGHLSVIYTTECQVNYALRVMRPILDSLKANRSRLPITMAGSSDVVEVRAECEQRDIDEVQKKAKDLVWATGCTSWSLDARTGRNSTMFPDWQYKFWLRTVFVAWSHLEYRRSSAGLAAARRRRSVSPGLIMAVFGTVSAAAASYAYRDPRWSTQVFELMARLMGSAKGFARIK